MQRIGLLIIMFLSSLGWAQVDCNIQECPNYLFILAPQPNPTPDSNLVADFIATVRGQNIGVVDNPEDLVKPGFDVDVSRFPKSEATESLKEILKDFDPSKLDLSIDAITQTLYPLYYSATPMLQSLQARSSEVVDITGTPCNGLLAVVLDSLNRSEVEALEELEKVREILEKKYGAGVTYGPNADGSHSTGGSSGAGTLQTTPFGANKGVQETYYTYQSLKSSNVTIAVIDTGVGNNKFSNQLIMQPGFDFVNTDTTPEDDYKYVDSSGQKFDFHGSPVAYIASSASAESSGTTPSIMPVKVCGNNDTSHTNDDCKVSNILLGVCYALKNFEANKTSDEQRLVINLSLGGETPVDILGQALWQAIDENAVVVASGGNDQQNQNFAKVEEYERGYYEHYYPAAYECRPSENVSGVCPYLFDRNGLIAVSSVDENDVRSSFSVRALYNDVAALGEYISNPLTDRRGTSFATPVVSGVAAALLNQFPTATPQQIETCIRVIAIATQPRSPAEGIGVGVLDPATSLNYLKYCKGLTRDNF
jgi:subtilisin family serine protease